MSSKIEKGDMVEVVKPYEGGETHYPIYEGQRFVVNNCLTCSCGRTGINIGLPYKINVQDKIPICRSCEALLAKGYGCLYDASRFRKIEPDYKLVEIEASVREELKKFNVTEKIDA